MAYKPEIDLPEDDEALARDRFMIRALDQCTKQIGRFRTSSASTA